VKECLQNGSCLEYLSRCALTARDCAVNCAIVPSHVCRFPGEEQRVVEGLPKRLLGTVAANFAVAVRTTRKWVRLPIVTVSIHKQVPQFSGVDREQASGQVAVRNRKHGDEGVKTVEEFLSEIQKLIIANQVLKAAAGNGSAD